jgi:hypothetical protein
MVLQARSGLFGIYLNDHLAAATAGVELARRVAGSGDPRLVEIAGEIAEDREELIRVMRRLALPIRRYKQVGAWLGERVGRLKLNGHLLTPSPLSRLVELEMLRLSVDGTTAMWTALRVGSGDVAGLDPARLDELIVRARRQSADLESRRIGAVDLIV